jgi:hypothetical protein
MHVSANPLPPGARKPGSVGRPVTAEVVVVDDEGRPRPPGEAGEIQVRGATVMSGYENDSAANAAAFRDRWYRTGDLGQFDADGYLFVTGRIKELINRGGEKVSPREVDDALAEHPAIARAVTFPVPHPTLGEDVAAALVLRPGATVTDTEIRRFVGSRLAPFKRHAVSSSSTRSPGRHRQAPSAWPRPARADDPVEPAGREAGPPSLTASRPRWRDLERVLGRAVAERFHRAGRRLARTTVATARIGGDRVRAASTSSSWPPCGSGRLTPRARPGRRGGELMSARGPRRVTALTGAHAAGVRLSRSADRATALPRQDPTARSSRCWRGPFSPPRPDTAYHVHHRVCRLGGQRRNRRWFTIADPHAIRRRAGKRVSASALGTVRPAVDDLAGVGCGDQARDRSRQPCPDLERGPLRARLRPPTTITRSSSIYLLLGGGHRYLARSSLALQLTRGRLTLPPCPSSGDYAVWREHSRRRRWRHGNVRRARLGTPSR